MRHLQHPALKRKRRAAEQIDHAAAVLRINVFQIQQNAFAAKQIFDDFATFLNLANVDNALAVGVLRLLRGAGIHPGIVNDVAVAALTATLRLVFLLVFVIFLCGGLALARCGLLFCPLPNGLFRENHKRTGVSFFLLVLFI